MRLPKVYFYQKKQELVVSFPLDGGRFHERFLKWVAYYPKYFCVI